MKKIKLFDYQQEMLEKIITKLTKNSFTPFRKRKEYVENYSVLVQMPTGTGKTYVMASVVKWFLDNHEKGEVWIVAHRRELVEQMQQTLDRFCLEYGEKEMVMEAKVRIRVLSIQWLGRHIGELEQAECTPGLIVVDEAHHALARSYQDLFLRNRMALKLGMTATPCRMKKESFGKLFGKLLTSPPTHDFIKRGYLAPYDYVVIGQFSQDQLTINSLKGRGSDGDYSVKEMDEKLNVPDSIKRLFDSVKQYAEGKRGIVYAIDIQHAQEIAAYYRQMGLRTVALDSTTPARKRADSVQAFRDGELDCLVNVNLFDEGFDCPDVEYIQMARPTLSLAMYLQMVGRGLRINRVNKKKVCMIIDNVGNYRKFGLPDKERKWDAMFSGLRDGKGILPPSLKPGVQVVGNDMMVTVKRGGNLDKMTEAQKRQYLKLVKPFREIEPYSIRYGLRVSTEDIILEPIYHYISDFVGDYAAYEAVNGNWGILNRRGKVIVPAQYQEIELLPRGRAKVNFYADVEKIMTIRELRGEKRYIRS